MIVEGRTMRVVKILVSDIQTRNDAAGITHPTRRVRLILENGAIFDRSFYCFAIDEGFVVQNFAAEEHEWTRFDPMVGAAATESA